MKPGMSKGNFVGYSKGGLPLYSFSGPGGTLPRSPASVIRYYLRQILEASDSRNIFFYLCLNLVRSLIYFISVLNVYVLTIWPLNRPNLSMIYIDAFCRG